MSAMTVVVVKQRPFLFTKELGFGQDVELIQSVKFQVLMRICCVVLQGTSADLT